MSQELPRVSIIIPSFNYGRYIERAIRSALAQLPLGQAQVIVADGGSQDGTAEILEKYRCQIEAWSRPDKGFVDAVTQGLKVARAEVVGILSADDYYLPGALAAALAALEKHPKAAMVCGWEILIDENRRVVHQTQPRGRITPRSIVAEQVPPQNACFVRRSWIDHVGGLRLLNGSNFAADVDLWYRILHFGTGFYVPHKFSVYQIHPTQMTQQGERIYRSLEWMIADCEAKSTLSSCFKLDPSEKRSVLAQAEMFWLGRCLEHKPTALARAKAIVAEPGLYNVATRQLAKKMLVGQDNQPPPTTVGLLLELPKRAWRRLGRLWRQKTEVIDLDWWKNATVFTEADVRKLWQPKRVNLRH